MPLFLSFLEERQAGKRSKGDKEKVQETKKEKRKRRTNEKEKKS
jgi:hypothetical protein